MDAAEPFDSSTAGAPIMIDRQVLTLALDGGETELWRHTSAVALGEPILMLHGIQSHPGWFVGSADALAAAGRPVYQFTRRGSGAATVLRGHARNPAQLMDDLDRAVGFVLDRTGADRVHLLGISWGGKYAACYALGGRRRLAGLTLVAPGIVARVQVGLATKLAIGASVLLRPRRTFEIPLSDPALFTDNPERRRFIENDPLRLQRAGARFLLTSRRMDWMLSGAATGSLALPVTLILAGVDRIIDNDRTEAAVRRLAADAPRVVHLCGAHTLEFEPDPAPLYAAELEGVG